MLNESKQIALLLGYRKTVVRRKKTDDKKKIQSNSTEAIAPLRIDNWPFVMNKKVMKQKIHIYVYTYIENKHF